MAFHQRARGGTRGPRDARTLRGAATHPTGLKGQEKHRPAPTWATRLPHALSLFFDPPPLLTWLGRCTVAAAASSPPPPAAGASAVGRYRAEPVGGGP